LEAGINRQALHCHSLSLYNPFLEKQLQLESQLPIDFQNTITLLIKNT
jgi:pseudouridylate synthase